MVPLVALLSLNVTIEFYQIKHWSDHLEIMLHHCDVRLLINLVFEFKSKLTVGYP